MGAEKEVKNKEVFDKVESTSHLSKEDVELLGIVFKAARSWAVNNIPEDEKTLLLMYSLKEKILNI
jgi:hypothetical protein